MKKIILFSIIIHVFLSGNVYAEEVIGSLYCENPKQGQLRVCPHIKELIIDVRYNGFSAELKIPSSRSHDISMAKFVKDKIKKIIQSDTRLAEKLDDIRFSARDDHSLPNKGELKVIVDFRTYISGGNVFIWGMIMNLDMKSGYTYGSSVKRCEDEPCIKSYITESVRTQLMAMNASI